MEQSKYPVPNCLTQAWILRGLESINGSHTVNAIMANLAAVMTGLVHSKAVEVTGAQ